MKLTYFAFNVCFQAVKEVVKQKVYKTCVDGGLWKLKPKILEGFQDYTKKCISLAWLMVTQVPPLEIDYQTFVFDKDHHETAQGKHSIPNNTGRQERQAENIAFYVWPGLSEYGGRVIQLGKVVCFT